MAVGDEMLARCLCLSKCLRLICTPSESLCTWRNVFDIGIDTGILSTRYLGLNASVRQMPSSEREWFYEINSTSLRSKWIP